MHTDRVRPWGLRTSTELGDAGPTTIVFRLRDTRYVETTRAEAGRRLRLSEPFAVDVDLGELASRPRPND